MPRATTILVLEPQPAHRSVLQAVLHELERPAMFWAETTSAAGDILSSIEPDVCFIDIDFDDRRGLTFVHGVRRGLYGRIDLPIIAVAASPHADTIARALQAGVTGLLVRPFAKAAVTLQLLRVRGDRRAFINTESYIGPDRRRWHDPDFIKPGRRDSDQNEDAFFLA